VFRAVSLVALSAALVGVAAAPAAAPKPAVPPFVQGLLVRRADGLASVPTRLPFRYAYRSYGWDAARRVETLRFGDVRFPPQAQRTLVFTAEPFGRPLARCGEGRESTLQMGGNKVYWDGTVAWRCVRGRGGLIVRLSAVHPTYPKFALGAVVASAKRVG
jgi:hypothetical protein